MKSVKSRDLLVDSESEKEEELDTNDGNKKFKDSIYMQLHRPSLLSSETSKNSYRGLVNVCILCYLVTHLREVSRTFWHWVSYSLRVAPTIFTAPSEWPMLWLFFSNYFFVVMTYLAECFVLKGITIPMEVTKKTIMKATTSRDCTSKYETITLWMHVANLTASIIFPAVICFHIKPHPASATIAVLNYGSSFLKAISYISVNHRERMCHIDAYLAYICKHETLNDDERPVDFDRSPQVMKWMEQRRRQGMASLGMLERYPANITFSNIMYFMALPPLCYDLRFVRTPKIRWGWLIRRIIEFAVIMSIIGHIIVDNLLPYAPVSDRPVLKEGIEGFLVFMEVWINICVANMQVWLLGFYAFFHLFLNITSEFCTFGDRLFYLDFWNATSVDQFWRMWYMPGHRWMVRHVYSPLIKQGATREKASVIVFLFSAIFHEYVISISFQNFSLKAFVVLCLQIPLAFVGKMLKGTQGGNLFFWCSMLVGPHELCTVIYVLEHYARTE